MPQNCLVPRLNGGRSLQRERKNYGDLRAAPGGPAAGPASLRLQVRSGLYRSHVPSGGAGDTQPEFGSVFLFSPTGVRDRLASAASGHGLAVVEGVMGFYDGLGNSDWASSWQLARETSTPVLLAARPQGTAHTLAAIIQGIQMFRTPSQVAGVLINGCTSRLAERLAAAIERETGLPVLGYLPKLPGGSIPSRHLGLFTPEEVEGLSALVDRIACQLERRRI